MKNSELDMEMVLSASRSMPEVEMVITEKSAFNGFTGRFGSRAYDLFAAFKVNFTPDPLKVTWIAFGEGWKPADDYIYTYNFKKEEIIERILSKEEFQYRQKPSKQDGHNEKRKERFINMHGSIKYYISYPKSSEEVKSFLSEIQNLTLIKMSADDIKI